MNWILSTFARATPIALLLFSQLSLATDAMPKCMDMGEILDFNHEEVLEWKKTTRNLWVSRAHIKGEIVKVYPDRNNHDHISVSIGPEKTDTIEVVYNLGFGPTPEMHVGQIIEACGEYVTSIEDAQYPASPDGAVLHWLHYDPKRRGRDGYMAIDGKVYGAGRAYDRGRRHELLEHAAH